MTRSYDLVVIGGGAGGLVAAREARRRGASTVIVQDGPVGGDCTFTGCVPSKTLLAAAAPGVDFDEAMARVHRAVDRIASTEDATALAVEGIDVVDGFARFTSPTAVAVDGSTIRSKRFVVATGARPAVPAIPGLRESTPLTNETLFDLTSQPESMIVLGGGPIGCEMAQAFARLGTRVTLVEALERILPREEPDASTVVAEALTADGVDVRVGSMVERVERLRDGDVCVHVDDGRAAADEIAAGRTSVQAAAVARATATRTGSLFVVGVPELARRGGRFVSVDGDLTPTSILELVDGTIREHARVADLDTAIDLMIDHTLRIARKEPIRVGVGHAMRDAVAERLAAGLEHHPGIEALTVYEVGPSVGAHTGPGTIGVVYAPTSPPTVQVDEGGDAR